MLWLVWFNWLEHPPIHWKVAGLIPSWSTHRRQLFSPLLSIKSIKILKKKIALKTILSFYIASCKQFSVVRVLTFKLPCTLQISYSLQRATESLILIWLFHKFQNSQLLLPEQLSVTLFLKQNLGLSVTFSMIAISSEHTKFY